MRGLEAYEAPCELCGRILNPFPDSGTGKPKMIVCFSCEPPLTLCDTCAGTHRKCRTDGSEPVSGLFSLAPWLVEKEGGRGGRT